VNHWRFPSTSVFIALIASCSPAPDPGATCPSELDQPLLNASTDERYLGVGESQRRALVEIFEDDEPETTCSGVLVAPNWILTAAHCDQIAPATVRLSKGVGAPSAQVPVVERKLHQDVDLALFRVDFAIAVVGVEAPLPETGSSAFDASSLGITPIGLPNTQAALDEGDSVELAGYGVREDGGANELRFLTESISAADQKTLTVSGFGASGACDGDSGGPLLMRASDGSLVVVGILSSGSATCLHDDDYVRTDTPSTRAWLASFVDRGADTSRECGSISHEGRCLYGNAVWCDSGSLVSESCGSTQPCGWDASSSGFRCVDARAPCSGVDSLGVCRENRALRCDRGQLQQQDCECGQCRVDGKTARAECTPGGAL
jgi:hypothetical protein